MSLIHLLLIVLVIALILGFVPIGGTPAPGVARPIYHGYGYGWGTGGLLGTILIIVLIMVLLGGI